MRKISNVQRLIYLRGQMDGERGMPLSKNLRDDDRATYERGYGRGYDAHYRAEKERKKHGNTGFPRPRHIAELDAAERMAS